MGIGRVASTKVANLDNICIRFLQHNTLLLLDWSNCQLLYSRLTDGISAYISMLNGARSINVSAQVLLSGLTVHKLH